MPPNQETRRFIDGSQLRVKICSLLSKPTKHLTEVPVEYLGFSIEDRFVVGYGLDFDGRYRNLPYIGLVTGIE